MRWILMVVLASVSLGVAGCAASNAQERKAKPGTYEKLSPFETGEDPFSVR